MLLRTDWVDAGGAATVVVALGWCVAAAVSARSGPSGASRWAAAVAAATGAAYVSPVLVPLAAGVWWALGLAQPD